MLSCNSNATQNGAKGLRSHTIISSKISYSCDFNRIVVAPGGEKAAVWKDLKPGAIYPGGFARSSEIGSVRLGQPGRFFKLIGEASAVNWRRSGHRLEALMNGRHYALIDPQAKTLHSWTLDPSWSRTNVKNQRWNGLRDAIDNQTFLAELAKPNGPFHHFAGGAVLADGPKLFPANRLKDYPLPSGQAVDYFDLGSILALADPQHRLSEDGFPLRPLFDAASGKILGTQSLGRARIDNGWSEIGTEHGVILDAVHNKGRLWSLTAMPNGARFLVVQGGAEAKRVEHICGSAASLYGSKTIAFETGPASVGGIWHRQDGEAGRTLAIRFPGGPFTSIEDVFPSPTTRRLTKNGVDILEVGGIGASDGISLPDGPEVTPALLRKLSDEIIRWLDQTDYARVVIIGESFGALGAMDLAGKLAHREASRISKLVLMAPLATLSAERAMNGRPVRTGSLQALAEEAAFGSTEERTQLARWSLDRANRVCALDSLAILVGEKDRRTPVSMLPACLADRATVVGGATHASLFYDERAWGWLE